MLDKKLKKEIVEKHAVTENDTGSSQVQIALLGKRIEEISAHLKSFPKDFHSRNGLIKLVCRRRKLLKYLVRTDVQAHRALIASLGLRSKVIIFLWFFSDIHL